MSPEELAALDKYKQPMSTLETPNYFSGIIYGDFGVGKTIWSSLFGRTIILAADQGFDSLKNHPDLAAKVDIAYYQGPKHWNLMAKAISSQAPGYQCDTYVIDTMSHIQEAYVGQLVNTSKYTDGKQRPRVVYNDPKLQIAGDPMELAGPPDYNRAKAFFTPGVLELVKAPVNLIFISHTREPGWMEKADKSKPAEDLALRPSITESLFKVIGREVHFIGLMDEENSGGKTIRTISFKKSRNHIAKSRIKELNAAPKIPANDAARILNEWRYRGD